MIEGTKNIIEAKKELKSNLPHIVFQFLVVKPNEHQLEDVKKLAHNLGVDEVVFKTDKIHPWRTEGAMQKEWIVVDYGDVVAHIFRKDKRPFFNLEELWGDGVITKIENLD